MLSHHAGTLVPEWFCEDRNLITKRFLPSARAQKFSAAFETVFKQLRRCSQGLAIEGDDEEGGVDPGLCGMGGSGAVVSSEFLNFIQLPRGWHF